MAKSKNLHTKLRIFSLWWKDCDLCSVFDGLFPLVKIQTGMGNVPKDLVLAFQRLADPCQVMKLGCYEILQMTLTVTCCLPV